MSQGKIAVVTGMSYLDVDRVIATLVLAKTLAAKHNSEVDVSLGYQVLPQKLATFVSTDKISVVESIKLAERFITLQNIDSEIADIKWSQADGEVTLELLNANGEKIDPEAATMQYTSTTYEQVYTVGVRSAKYLLRLLSNTQEKDLTEVALTSIDVVNKKDTGFEADRFVTEDVHSLSAAVYSYCKAQEIEISKPDLTELLSGVYWKTNSLRNYYTTPATFGITQGLITAGANLKTAVSRIYGTLDSEVESIWKELSSSLVREEKLTVSTATTEKDYELLLNNTVLPVFAPQFFADTQASITALPISANKTLVLVSSLTPKLNLHKLLRDYSPKGDDLQVKITIEEPTASALQKIKQALAAQESASKIPTLMANGQNKQQAPTPIEQALPKPVTEPKKATPVVTANKPAGNITPKNDTDPLAPASQDDLKTLAEQNEEEDNSGGSSLFGGFGGGGNGDPLPAAKD